MVSLQANCSLDGALTLMSHRAFCNECTVDDIVDAVLDGTIRLHPWDLRSN
jgi:hypothetical protein